MHFKIVRIFVPNVLQHSNTLKKNAVNHADNLG